MCYVNQGQVCHIIKEGSILFFYRAAANFSNEQNNLHSKSGKKRVIIGENTNYIPNE